MTIESISLQDLVHSIPVVLNQTVYSDNEITKHMFGVEYDEQQKIFVYTGKLYIMNIEKDNVLGSVSTSLGVLTLKSVSEGAYAVGKLKGQKVCIVGYSMHIEPSNYKHIQRDVNLLKVKNKSPRLLCRGLVSA